MRNTRHNPATKQPAKAVTKKAAGRAVTKKIEKLIRSGRISDAELRLFACRCARQTLARARGMGQEPDARGDTAVWAAVKFARGEISVSELEAARDAADAAPIGDNACFVARLAAGSRADDAASDASYYAAFGLNRFDLQEPYRSEYFDAERERQLAELEGLVMTNKSTRHNPATCRTSTCRNPACSTMRRNPADEGEDEGVYTFDELDESAKDRARQWYRSEDGGLHDDWWEHTYEDASTIAELMGIDIDTKRGGRSPAISFDLGNNGGLAFEGSYRYAKGSVAKVKAYAPSDKEIHGIALALQETQREHFYKLRASVTGKRRDDGINVTVEKDDVWECPRDAEDGITDALEDFAHWIYKRLQAEEEYLTSDETVDESIRANGYTFDEDGHFVG